MKKIYVTLLFLISTAYISFSQYNMSTDINDSIFRKCSDTIYDSGGSLASYADNEAFIFYISPSNAITLNLYVTDINMGDADYLKIYDGLAPDTTLIATINTLNNGNPTDTLFFRSSANTITLKWLSDASSNSDGLKLFWNGTIRSVIELTHASCNGADNGEIIITPIGGTYPYTYDWSNAAPDDSVNSGLIANTYSITVTDVNGCSDTTNNISIAETSSIAFTNTITNATCATASNGEIVVNASGGSGSYEYAIDGGLWQISNTFSSLTGGATYNISVRDANTNACTSTQTNIPLNNNTALSVSSLSTGDASCESVADGTITIAANGGSGNYTYTIGADSNTNGVFTGYVGSLAGTDYTITIEDQANASCSTTSTATVLAPANVNFTFTKTNTTCPAVNNGTITVSATGASSTYNYYINGSLNTGNSNIFLNVDGSATPGTNHIILVEDKINTACNSSQSIAMIDNDTIKFTSQTFDASCPTVDDGQIVVSPTGGSGAYKYFIGATNNGSATFSTLQGDRTYTIRVEDNTQSSCATSSNITVGTANAISAATSEVDASCEAVTDGEIHITASGASGSFFYAIDADNNTTGNFTGYAGSLAGTNYTVTVTDQTTPGCTTSIVATVYSSANVSFTTLVTDASCDAVADGIITVTASGASGAYNYTIDADSNTDGLFTGYDGSDAGTDYTLLITDQTTPACFATGSVTVSQFSALSVASLSTEDASCEGVSDGTITIAANGGSGNYTYTIGADSNTNGIFTGYAGSLAGTDYTITIEDQANASCNTTSTATVLAPANVDFTFTKTNTTCPAVNNGTITVSATGASGVFKYFINGVQNTANSNVFTGLAGETDYIVSIEDAMQAGCTQNRSISIENNPLLSFTSEVIKASCIAVPDGKIAVSVTGGSGAYNYFINNTPNATNTFSALNGGTTYTIEIQDNTNPSCLSTQNLTTGFLSTIGGTYNTTMPLCNGSANGSITIAAFGGNGGYEYKIDTTGALWQNANTFLNLADNTYNVLIRNSTVPACESTLSDIILTAPTPLHLSVSTTQILCTNEATGAIDLTVSEGTAPYSYNWSGGQTTEDVSNIPANSYNVTVSDAHNCTSSIIDIVIAEPLNALDVSIDSYTNVSFAGGANGTAIASASGGTGTISYLWSNLQTLASATNLSKGTYIVTAKDQNLCTDTAHVFINEPDELLPGIIKVHDRIYDSICKGTKPLQFMDSVSPSGGFGSYTFYWEYSYNLTNWSTYESNANEFSTFNINLTQNTYFRRKVEDQNLIAKYSNIISIYTIDTVSVSIVGLDKKYCESDAAETIYGVPAPGLKSTGTFGILTGLSDAGNGSATFNPLNVLLNNVSVTYTYTNEYGCSSRAKQAVEILDTVGLSMNLNTTYGINDDTVNVVIHPANATLYGPGIDTYKKQFIPKVAGTENSPHRISLQYTDPVSGCSNSLERFVSIFSAGGDILKIDGSPFNTVCIDDDPIQIKAFPEKVQDFTGSYTPLTGLTDLGDSTAIFDPSTVGAGIKTITFNYESDGLTYEVTKDIHVVDVGTIHINPLNPAYCIDNVPIALSVDGASPSGFFSGNGYDNTNGVSKFNPSLAGVGTGKIIKYRTTTVEGCWKEDSISIDINPLPTITNLVYKRIFNKDEVPFEMAATVDIAGTGSFSGKGVVNNSGSYSFYPSIAGDGNHQLQYNYTDINGCKTDSTDIIKVERNDMVISVPDADKIYCIYQNVDTLIAVPDTFNVVGSFSGPGISNKGNNTAIFDPALAGNGSFTIDYTYFVYAGPEAYDTARFTVSTTLTVDEIPSVDFGLLQSSYCINNETIKLTGTPKATFPFGRFSGSGITNNIDNADFSPSVAGAGTFDITYNYINTNGCTDSITKSVTIHELPVITDLAIKHIYNIEGRIDTLRGTPSKGTFSGSNGILQDSIFYPAIAGIGSYTVKYEYTDMFSCINDSTFTIKVESNKDASIIVPDADKIYCIYQTKDTLYAIPDTFNVEGIFSGNGITNLGNNKALFDPAIAGVGKHTIRYKYLVELHNNPVDTASFEISTDLEVDEIGTIDFGTLEHFYCVDDNSITLIGEPRTTFPLGEFIGEGLTNSIDKAIFSPASAGPGTFDIKYRYQNANGCKDSITKSVTVIDLPEITSLNVRSLYNVIEDQDTLRGIPAGGVFYGSGIISDSIFSPGLAKVGIHDITYEITDQYACKNNTAFSIKVESAKGYILVPDADKVYCYTQSSDTLIGVPDTLQTTGVFSGPGITDLHNNKAIFNPVLAGSGNHVISYKYYGSSNKAEFEVYTNISVDSIGALYFDIADTSYCENDLQFKVPVLNSRNTGTHEFTGISGDGALTSQGKSAFIAPQYIAPGAYDVVYTYTSLYGCKDSIAQGFSFTALPDVHFTIDTLLNIDDKEQQLTGTPAGGSFSGNGVFYNASNTSYFFSPAIAGAGYFGISYKFTDENSCSNASTVSVLVEISDAVIEGYDKYYCYYDHVDTITARSSKGLRGGTISGNGIFEFNPPKTDSVLFRPSAAGAGSHEILYAYLGKDSSTVFEKRAYINVDENRVVSISGLNKDEYCNDADYEILTAFPQGGVFSGDGVTANRFEPQKAVIGNNYIAYTHTIVFTENFGNDTIKVCSTHGVDSAIVHKIPNVSFDGINAKKQYCNNGPEVYLTPNPDGGTFSANISKGNGTYYFNPANLNIDDNSITYRYTDGHNCTNIYRDTIAIKKISDLRIVGLEAQYCRKFGNDTITGEIIGSPDDEAGSFTGAGISDNILNDGKAIFNSDSVDLGGNYIIRYQYTNEYGCSNYIEKSTIVNDLPNVELSGFEASYCQDNSTVKLLGSPKTGGVGIYTINDVSGETWNDFPLNNSGKHFVSYKFTDTKNCVNTDSDSIIVYPAPSVHFNINDECIVDSIIFYDKTTSEDQVVAWNWNFGDLLNLPENESTQKNPKHLYSTDGSKIISLSVTTASNCTYSKDSVISLGNGPSANFTWSNECLGKDPVSFSDLTTGLGIESYLWIFGDGKTDSVASPHHKYTSTGDFDVTLHVSTANSCNDSIVKTVSIRPRVVTYPYIEDFESGKAHWVSHTADSLNSWEMGTPSGTFLKDAASGKNAWCTNLDGTFHSNEESWVDGPCFDFSYLQRPMIKLNYRSHTDHGFDGAVFQASKDNGTTWETVGELNDGINWFNAGNIWGNPGNQSLGQYGWTGIDSPEWKEARHDLDDYAKSKNVRFRVAFGSDASSNKEGFAFDDIWIGERTRNVLVEQFTNASSDLCAKIMPAYNGYIDSNAVDVIDIQYHTNFNGEDKMYSDNPSVSSAKAFYYGVSTEPYSIMDGNRFQNQTSLLVTDPKYLKLRSLEDPPFNIKLSVEKTASEIYATTSVTALTNIPKTNISVHIVVIEDEITSITGNNGENSFKRVVKALIPSSGSVGFDKEWFSGSSEEIEGSWKYKNVYDANQLSVVVYVQNDITKEIYQAVSSNNDMTAPVSLFEVDESAHLSILVYPNPSSSQTYVLINGTVSDNSTIRITNEIGQELAKLPVQQSKVISLPTDNLTSGIYMVRLISDGAVIDTGKLIIVK